MNAMRHLPWMPVESLESSRRAFREMQLYIFLFNCAKCRAWGTCSWVKITSISCSKRSRPRREFQWTAIDVFFSSGCVYTYFARFRNGSVVQRSDLGRPSGGQIKYDFLRNLMISQCESCSTHVLCIINTSRRRRQTLLPFCEHSLHLPPHMLGSYKGNCRQCACVCVSSRLTIFGLMVYAEQNSGITSQALRGIFRSADITTYN